uniref:Uncharacterized protein n=1 Tax=Panagrolaimus sp. ES5 TaxID=591445 RepID=A0AC34GCQ4_9BILA
MFKKILCLFVILTILSSTFINAALVNVPTAMNNAVTGALKDAGFGPFGNGKKGEWRRRKFPKPANKDDEAKMDDDDDMGMDKRSYYGDYYYYYCG